MNATKFKAMVPAAAVALIVCLALLLIAYKRRLDHELRYSEALLKQRVELQVLAVRLQQDTLELQTNHIAALKELLQLKKGPQ